MEFEPIMKFLRLTCRENVKEQTLEHYIYTVTHSPIRAQADEVSLELGVTLATQNCLAADLLVPVKPFVKHIVDILLGEVKSGSLRSKEMDKIQQELAAACSGTPYQTMRAAATLLFYVPNDEELLKTIQDVTLGMLSNHLISSKQALFQAIAKLKTAPPEAVDSQFTRQKSPSSSGAIAYVTFPSL